MWRSSRTAADFSQERKQRPRVARLIQRVIEAGHLPEHPVGALLVAASDRDQLVALVDQPQIDSSIINRVIIEYEKHPSLIVIPTYNGRNGHPVLIDLQLRDQLLAFDASQGLRQVIHAHAAEVLHIEVATDAVLTDFDYPEDYQRLALHKKS